ncbi:MAG: outer membrane beta-barrel protein [Gracilimonas sp.]|uniref:outer membrane beta-barrel protein n=1 Tax=Gracilimonas sp. TaxID=1974203 RepID=UPI0019C9C5B2|nr:outer membrane beta-barrel protein [Gracilimonas sp.]MBD3616209.1 outer membrane beta-barrel protein [Gracilimonas sp.]
MNSKDEHKDPLEQFFRKKAEEYDISYREEDWLDLEKKLDRRQAAKTRQRRTYFAAAAVLLIVSAMGYFIYDNSNKIDQLNRQLEDNMTTGVLPDSAREDTAKEPEALPPVNREMLANIPQETQKPTEITDDVTPKSGPEKQDQQAVINADPVSVSGGELAHAELRSVSYSELMDDDLSLSTGNNIPGDTGYLASVSYGGIVIPSGNLPQRDGLDRTAPSRFEFGLIVSPDISTVGGISNFHEPGYKLGVSAGYHINDRFTISSGVIHSNVKYSSGSQYYDPPAYWNPGGTPSGIRAQCFILDIPVTLKYDVKQFGNSRFFATGGLSSYVMLSEDYWFDYNNGGYSGGQTTTLNEKSGKAHLFSNAGFSVGYEYDLHKNWSLKAEPFIKVPLREVGWGNVKLYTLGTFVSVSYRL